MKKRFLAMIGLATMILGSTVSAVVRHERANRPFVDRMVFRMTRHLDLTDAQQSQVRSILEAEHSRIAALLTAAAMDRQQLQESTANGKFDEAQVRSLAARQAQQLTEMIVEKERVKAKVYNEVLTAEQRSKADQLQQRWDFRFRFLHQCRRHPAVDAIGKSSANGCEPPS
jgi:Spy/CpxP family protein refolding chaperone